MGFTHIDFVWFSLYLSTSSAAKVTLLCNTNLAVDNFNTAQLKLGGVEIVHVLTHYHSDHRPGLTKAFRGRLICSAITADLIQSAPGVNKHFVEVLRLHQELTIEPPSESGLSPYSITFIDANHCPGAVSIVIKGPTFAYFYMGDSRVTEAVIEDAQSIHPNPFHIAWVDSTFYDDHSLWDAMPSQKESIAALVEFAKTRPEGLALEFELLGTEVLLEAILDAFPKQRILVMSEDRMSELELIYATDPDRLSQLVLHQGVTVDPRRNKFIIQTRRSATPPGFIRVRATTQRWAGSIRTIQVDGTCPIIEFDPERAQCFIFYSMHSCRREIDEMMNQLQVQSVRQLFKSIEILDRESSSDSADSPDVPRRRKCPRRAFQFSVTDMWLDNLFDSQETVPPDGSNGFVGDIVLPTWGDRKPG